MNSLSKIALTLAAAAWASQAVAQITLYENDGFQGRTFTTQRPVGNLARSGFNDRASSVIVLSNRWEVCENASFGGRCIVLRPGQYPSLSAMGLNDRVTSVRTVATNARVDEKRYSPAPAPQHDFRWRDNERLYEATVTSVRAVVATPEQKCWVERQQVVQPRGDANVPATIAGAIIGGILGHQIGGGTGRDIATVGGVVAGAAVGSRVGRESGGQQASSQDVRRCTSVPSQARPEYWDVTYTYKGKVHRVQMTTPPGRTITVNRQGEPRAY